MTANESDLSDHNHEVDDEFGEWKASTWQGYHDEADLCKSMLRTVTSTVPLRIRSSRISTGSGLFIEQELEEGREIYRSDPLLICIDAGHQSICHSCLKDTKGIIDATGRIRTQNGSVAKACAGCRVARFCSKECQKAAWNKFHRDECSILKVSPKLPAQQLALCRLIFWQQRRKITTTQGNMINVLQTHFSEYMDDSDRGKALMDNAMDLRKATGQDSKRQSPELALVWRLLPMMFTNCIRIRPATQKDFIGAALDLATATINHSCDPNAFAFFEDSQLRVRSLKKLSSGDELTICYIDPTISVALRQDIFRREHFFTCHCSRCSIEAREITHLLGGKAMTEAKLATFNEVQHDILKLISNATIAAKYPGVYRQFEDLGLIETQLLTLTSRPFDGPHWPAHVEPLPSARFALAMLHFEKDEFLSALSQGLRGKLASHRRSGPECANELFDVVRLLTAVGDMSPDAFQGFDKCTQEDVREVVYGYAWQLTREAAAAFGHDSKYTTAMCDLYAMLVRMAVDKPGSKEFAKKFAAAQDRVMWWANVPLNYRLYLTS